MLPLLDLVAAVVAALVGALVLGALGLSRAVVIGEGTPVVLIVAVVSVPLVVSDVRDRLLPNVLTAPILLSVLASTVGQVMTGRVPQEARAVVVTALALGLLRLAGGLGMGDVKLGAALAYPLALRGERARIPFGPFQLAAFWLVLAGA